MSTAVLLISGISVRQMTSFRLQLELLKRGFENRGVAGRIVGISDSGDSGSDLPFMDGRTHASLLEETGADSTILLGYPDQFPLLSESPAGPCYLWAQMSRVPRQPVPNVTAVPLTGCTRSYLQKAGWRLGPTIPHAVDTAVFAPGRNRYESDNLVRYVSVGANSRRKRFDLLLDAFDRARRELEQAGISATLTIKTDAEMKPGGFDIPKLCRQESSHSVRVVTGTLSESSLADLYRSHDVYVHAAEWEGFCIPAAEALASGLPVICPAGQGPAELLPYDESLVAAAHEDPDVPDSVRVVDTAALASQMVRLAGDSGLRQTLGTAGRRHACRQFSVEVVAARWLDVLAP